MRRRAVLLCALLALCGVITLGLSVRAVAQSDQLIYADTLQNGWQNWSWCSTDFASKDYIHSGGNSVKITYTGGWQGFYLDHAGFGGALYADLSFWIHGGTVNGRNLLIVGLVNQHQVSSLNLNNYIEGGAVTAGAWHRVRVPLHDLKLDTQTSVTGFYIQNNTAGAQAPFYVDDITLESNAVPTTVNINVNATIPGRVVDSRLFGVNAAVWDGAFNTAATTTLLTQAANRVLRFPGGSTSDGYMWDTGKSVGNTQPWQTSFDAFAGIAKATNAQVFITANYGSGSPQYAAQWVTYSNVTKGYGFKYWEIGNEVYGSWEYDTHSSAHDPYTYALQVKDYMTKMKAADPTIKVGVVAITGEDSYANNTNHPATNPRTGQKHNGWTPVMLATLKSLGVTPDFLIHHRYAQGPGSENDTYLLQEAAGWKSDAANLRQMLTDYLGTAGANVELVSTELNSVSSSPGKQSTSLVNGLYMADCIGNLLQTEFNAAVWWDLRNGPEVHNTDPGLYGWRQYGDYGIVSPQNVAYPTYYAMKLLSHFARGGDRVAAAATDYPYVSAYAVQRVDGTLALLLLNKSATNTFAGNITIVGFTPQSAATVYAYGIPQDQAAQTGTGSPDIAQSAIANAGSSFAYNLAPYSATVLSLSATTTPPPPVLTPVYQINCGGGAVAPFAADGYDNAHLVYTNTAAVNLSTVAHPAPQAVYQSQAYSNSPLVYTFPNLTPGATYSVRLHFAELYYTGSNQRLFSASLNGQSLFTNLDLVATTGGRSVGLERDYTTTANSSGQIVLTLTPVLKSAVINGIEILK